VAVEIHPEQFNDRGDAVFYNGTGAINSAASFARK
jgi:hypothetical protein